jgi:hypothetical protein
MLSRYPRSAPATAPTTGRLSSNAIPHVDVDTEPWVVDVLGQVQTALDGVRVPNMSKLTVEGLICLTGPDSSELTSVSTEGSMLDPDHPVWDVDGKADS